ncbi:galactokinase [Streptomyces sp. NPDC005963]|uniref:galactokinase n=1 Tax=Streptomyces sp. NPDC005963 TaxID=3156721 RepID=UPI0033E34BA8
MSAGVWTAPGRVNLIGEHTDYNDGLVMPFALPLAIEVSASPRTDGRLRLSSANAPGQSVELRIEDLAPGSGPGGWTDYPAGVVWALREAGHPVAGADLHFDSTLPTGAGLSSSAALEVVTGLALRDLHELDVNRTELALLCRRAENVYAGAPTGIMDQMASACCTEGHALLLDTRDLSGRQIPLDLAARGLALLVVDTRVTHAHSQGEYGERRAGCESAARLLGVPALRDLTPQDLPAALERLPTGLGPLVRHVVTENARVERSAERLLVGEPGELGPILTEGHASLRDDFRVSCPELDLVVESALAAGALGARMTGGGFGGSAIALVPGAQAGAVADAVVSAFGRASYRTPLVLEAVPSSGARRLS